MTLLLLLVAVGCARPTDVTVPNYQASLDYDGTFERATLPPPPHTAEHRPQHGEIVDAGPHEGQSMPVEAMPGNDGNQHEPLPPMPGDEQPAVEPYQGRTPDPGDRPDIDRSRPDDRDRGRTERPRVELLTGCGWDEMDSHGNFNSDCLQCNMANAAARYLQKISKGAFTVGTEAGNDIRVINIRSEDGRRIDRSLGAKGHTLTEIQGHAVDGRYEPLTPVMVVYRPGKDPEIINGWQGGEPETDDAAWYLSGFLGHRRDTPETWASSSGYAPVGVAMSAWLQDEDRQRRNQAWGATVNVREILRTLGVTGSREIAPRTTLVVPEDVRPTWDTSTTQPRLIFTKAPYVQWKFGIITRTKYISHIDVSADFTKISVHAEGYKTSFPITLEW